jgi:glycosyltransferase involved in cell wall biosynthesis
LRQLKSIIKKNKVDIVHSHLNPAGWYTHLACPRSVAHVHTVHTTYSMDTETRPSMLFLEKHFYFNRKDCNVILLSDYTKADFLNAIHFRGKTFVLNNFVPDSYFSNTAKEYNNGNLKLVAAGSLKELKNFEYLLEVFTRIKDINVSLDIFGTGDTSKYEKFIREHQLNIRMMGHVNDLSAVLSGYDLFIMPSIFEGFPLALFESMASGLPVMLSDIPPLKTIVKEHAIYFPLDDPDEVARQLRAIFNREIDINEMAKAGKLFAEKTVRRDIYRQKLLNIYDELLSASSGKKHESAILPTLNSAPGK